MAQYDYACMECDKTYTKTRSMQDADPGYVCDECGNRLARVYATPAIAFKGKGFYSTGG